MIDSEFVARVSRTFKKVVSPKKEYSKFSKYKNKLLSLLTFGRLSSPTVDTIQEFIDAGLDINMITSVEKMNIVMFICVWQPTFINLEKDWIKCFIKAGVNLDHVDVNGDNTRDYLCRYDIEI